MLGELKNLGIRLDDFGTGYSSRSYLRGSPVDIVEIDRSFVADRGRDPAATATDAAVTRLVHHLGKLVTAEVVETAAQRDEVIRVGCELAQGFFFAHRRGAYDLALQLTRRWVVRLDHSARSAAIFRTWWEGGAVGGSLSAPCRDVPFPAASDTGLMPWGPDSKPMSDVDPAVPSNGATHHPATELQNLMLATDVVESFLQEIADSAATALGGAISASVTIAREGRPVTVASSDAFAEQFDEVQYTQLEGPCLTALRTGETILMDDLAADRRFERYNPRAFALGVRSSLSLPLTGGHQGVGALNLYARDVGGFGAAAQADAALFAGDALRALNLAIRLAYQVEMTEELRAALQSRTLIDQTLGVIMSQRECDADAAMAILRTDSLDRDIAPPVRAAQTLSAVSTPPGSDGVPVSTTAEI